MTEKEYWLGFAITPGIGPIRFASLLAYFGTAKAAWHASFEDIKQSGVGNAAAEQFMHMRDMISIQGYVQQLEQAQVAYVILTEDGYPKLLSQSKKAPFVLFIKAAKEFDFHTADVQQAIAVVGTRKVTEYGKQVTEMLTRDLVQAGSVIVSGLALGVDSIAHRVTLEHAGKTIAVLGCGVDYCYPRENMAIYAAILAQSGAIVSEYGLGIKPNKGTFPSRNRIIAGLSLGVVVTEGASQSGSLITAQDAFANNRPVFAVPGPITSSFSKGPYELIQKGATLVTSSKEILTTLHLGSTHFRKATVRRRGETNEEQRIIDLLGEQQLHFDELVRIIGIDPAQLGSILSLMEMKGVIKNVSGSIFSLALDE